jgi:hypothetical protein
MAAVLQCRDTVRKEATMKIALFTGMLAVALLCGCSSDGGPVIRDQPEDMNVSPRSMDAYDPAARELHKDQQ